MFHTPEYIEYLEKVSNKNMARLHDKKNPCKLKCVEVWGSSRGQEGETIVIDIYYYYPNIF